MKWIDNADSYICPICGNEVKYIKPYCDKCGARADDYSPIKGFRVGEIKEDVRVNICGIPHTIIEKEDVFNADGIHFGQIDYKKCEILIAKDMTNESKEETICHEMLHGMLVHLGYDELSQDEKFVQALGNAIYNGFMIREV